MLRKELRPGDILCQFATGSWAGRIIAFGQALTRHHHSNIVHVGVMFDDTYCVEALNKGIRARDLRIQNRALHYLVFRPVNRNLAQGAADCANMMLKINAAQKTLPYNLTGAVGSIFGKGTAPMTPAAMDLLLDRILSGKNHPFFCSQFVVFLYQFVAEQNGLPATSLLNLPDPKVSPALLTTFLDTSANFKLAGDLPAGAR
jgi:hypothetical protein